ncbi:MAG: polyprenol monophosphomannose synthase [bacterium]
MMKTLIIVPTYNERSSVNELISAILDLGPEHHILIIDDNSPDGTGAVANALAGKYKNCVFIMHRKKKLGMGTAYVEGYKFALKNGYDYVIQMDADLSHHPKYIPEFLSLMKKYDLVIGSRFLGGRLNVVNWPWKRVILSRLANKYINVILNIGLSDGTSGYKCLSRKFLEAINFGKIRSRDFAVQIEINYLAKEDCFKIGEFPFTFNNRKTGASKLSWRMIKEAFFLVLFLKFRSLFKKRA